MAQTHANRVVFGVTATQNHAHRVVFGITVAQNSTNRVIFGITMAQSYQGPEDKIFFNLQKHKS